MRLHKGCYGSEFQREGHLFGLGCGQLRSGPGKITHNSGWYNLEGEKLGFGDLSNDDFTRIRDELRADEVFVVLSEQKSFSDFVERAGIIGSMSIVSEKEASPGFAYIVEHAMYIIAPGKLYWVNQCGTYAESDRITISGLSFQVLQAGDTGRFLLQWLTQSR